jgi:hypothetical protein
MNGLDEVFGKHYQQILSVYRELYKEELMDGNINRELRENMKNLTECNPKICDSIKRILKEKSLESIVEKDLDLICSNIPLTITKIIPEANLEQYDKQAKLEMIKKFISTNPGKQIFEISDAIELHSKEVRKIIYANETDFRTISKHSAGQIKYFWYLKEQI